MVGIERWKRFRRVMVSASGSTELREGDVLLIDMSDSQVDLREFCGEQRLEPMVLRGDYFSEQSRNVGMAEVSLIPDSALLGKSLREAAFRSRYDLNVVGIRRHGETLGGKLVDEPLELGDILLVIGDWKAIRQLQAKTHDFIVLNLPAEVDEVAPAITQAPHALFCLALMVAMMLTDEIPNPIAALIACLLMGKFRCIDMESAYKSIHWPSIILIVGMMPFAQALQKTGGVDLIVRGLMDVAGGAGAARDAAVPVRLVRHHRPVYFQHRDGGADGADRHRRRARNGRLAIPVRDGYRHRRVRRLYDAGLFTGQHAGAGAGQLQVRRFRASRRAVHPVGNGGQRDCGTVALRLFSGAARLRRRGLQRTVEADFVQ